jgi:hypothetical protein
LIGGRSTQNRQKTINVVSPVLAVREGRGEDFERDIAAEFGIVCSIDLAHPAHAQNRNDLISARPEYPPEVAWES